MIPTEAKHEAEYAKGLSALIFHCWHGNGNIFSANIFGTLIPEVGLNTQE